MTRLQTIKEMAIVWGTMTVIFLPVRFLFVTYVSDSWYGSFGLISGISILILILTLKNKLGWFGEMFKRQMRRLHSGKLGKIITIQVIFYLIFFGTFVFSIEMGNSYYSDLKDELAAETLHISDHGIEIKDLDEITAERMLLGALLSFFVFVFEFPLFAAAIALINDMFDGWLLHFYTVAFVENLEIFIIMIFFRMSLLKNKIPKF